MGCGQDGGFSPIEDAANCNKLSDDESQTITFRDVRVPRSGVYYYKILTTLNNGQVRESKVSQVFIN